MADEIDIKKLQEICKEAGRDICPETAEITWRYGGILDPYGDVTLPHELSTIGRVYFARTLGSNQWVSFHDLPVDTRDVLRNRMNAG